MTDDKRRARGRGETRHEARRREECVRRMIAREVKSQWIEYLSRPSVRHSLNVRVDLTLKQRRDSELVTARPREDALTVRVPPRRIPLRDAAVFAPFYYLNEDEARRIAVRMMNRLNKQLFGNRARRNGRQRLTALICQHDRNTRRHLHCLFAVPPDVTLEQFRNSLHRSLDSEPFVYRIQRAERIENLAASILYNINESKSLARNTIVYLYPQLNTSHNTQEPQ